MARMLEAYREAHGPHLKYTRKPMSLIQNTYGEAHFHEYPRASTGSGHFARASPYVFTGFPVQKHGLPRTKTWAFPYCI